MLLRYKVRPIFSNSRMLETMRMDHNQGLIARDPEAVVDSA